MKKLLLLFLVMSFCACNSKNASSSLRDASIEKATSSTAFDAKLDTLNSVEKENHFQKASFEKADWRDTYCPKCNRRCCSPCTAGGHPSTCAQTKFQYCSTCGHSSANHQSIPH